MRSASLARTQLATLCLGCLICARANMASATTFYIPYGSSRTTNIVTIAGTHSCQVNGISQYKNTEWYVNGGYTGEAENDWSGVWADDPEYTTSFSSGTKEIKALVYDNYWNYLGYYIFNITVDTTPPTVPALSLPSNGAVTSDNTVALDWTDSSDSGTGVGGYEVQVDDSSAFSSPNWTTTSSGSSATTASLSDGLYYWHVRAKDRANPANWSSWSSSRSFRVDTTAPSVPVLTTRS